MLISIYTVRIECRFVYIFTNVKTNTIHKSRTCKKRICRYCKWEHGKGGDAPALFMNVGTHLAFYPELRLAISTTNFSNTYKLLRTLIEMRSTSFSFETLFMSESRNSYLITLLGWMEYFIYWKIFRLRRIPQYNDNKRIPIDVFI